MDYYEKNRTWVLYKLDYVRWTVHAVRPPLRADKMLPLLLGTTRIIVEVLMILYWEGVCGAGETAGLEAQKVTQDPGPGLPDCRLRGFTTLNTLIADFVKCCDENQCLFNTSKTKEVVTSTGHPGFRH